MNNCDHCKFVFRKWEEEPCCSCEKGESFELSIPKIKKTQDNVNSPSHYQGKVEVIDYITDKLSAEEFEGYCAGNVIKYISRYKKKNGLEDLKKCEWYLKKLIQILESNKTT